MSWRVSILKDQGMYQTQCAVCIKRQSQSQLLVRSAVITSVMSVLLCGQEIGVSHNATTEQYMYYVSLPAPTPNTDGVGYL